LPRGWSVFVILGACRKHPTPLLSLRPISPQDLLATCVHILLYYIYFDFGAFILTSYLLNRI
jgi:hypothetical protein